MKKSFRKNILLFTVTLLAVLISFSLIGCPDPVNGNRKTGTGDPDHTHEYGDDWHYNAFQHWRECSCGEKIDIADHIFDGFDCTVCDYQAQPLFASVTDFLDAILYADQPNYSVNLAGAYDSGDTFSETFEVKGKYSYSRYEENDYYSESYAVIEPSGSDYKVEEYYRSTFALNWSYNNWETPWNNRFADDYSDFGDLPTDASQYGNAEANVYTYTFDWNIPVQPGITYYTTYTIKILTDKVIITEFYEYTDAANPMDDESNENTYTFTFGTATVSGISTDIINEARGITAAASFGFVFDTLPDSFNDNSYPIEEWVWTWNSNMRSEIGNYLRDEKGLDDSKAGSMGYSAPADLVGKTTVEIRLMGNPPPDDPTGYWHFYVTYYQSVNLTNSDRYVIPYTDLENYRRQDYFEDAANSSVAAGEFTGRGSAVLYFYYWNYKDVNMVNELRSMVETQGWVAGTPSTTLPVQPDDVGTRFDYNGEKDQFSIYYASTSGGNTVYTYVRP